MRRKSTEEQKKRDKEYMKKYDSEISIPRERKEREEFRATFGDKCILCPHTTMLVLHEIHGKKHPPSNSITAYKKYVEAHRKDFVLICKGCHWKLHWFIKNNPKKVIELIMEGLKND